MENSEHLSKPIVFSKHSLEQCIERGTNEYEIEQAILKGKCDIAKKDRKIYYLSFPYREKWQGKHYAVKQVAPIVVEEEDKIVVITVYTFYY